MRPETSVYAHFSGHAHFRSLAGDSQLTRFVVTEHPSEQGEIVRSPRNGLLLEVKHSRRKMEEDDGNDAGIRIAASLREQLPVPGRSAAPDQFHRRSKAL